MATDFIPIKATWRGLLPALIMVLENGNATGRANAIAELKRMAEIADAYVAEHEAKESTL
jgi:hypothetical protein